MSVGVFKVVCSYSSLSSCRHSLRCRSALLTLLYFMPSQQARLFIEPLVWTPKYRGKVLASAKVKQVVRRALETIARWKHQELLELNIQDDHVHMILILLPKDSPSYAMQIIKGRSLLLGSRKRLSTRVVPMKGIAYGREDTSYLQSESMN